MGLAPTSNASSLPITYLRLATMRRMVANLKYVMGSEDAFDVGANPIYRGTLTADGREDSLESQAVSAVFAHEQGKSRPTQEQLQEILDFERQIFVAQSTDNVGGDL